MVCFLVYWDSLIWCKPALGKKDIRVGVYGEIVEESGDSGRYDCLGVESLALFLMLQDNGQGREGEQKI